MAKAMICDRCGDFFKLETVRHGDFVTDYMAVGLRVSINGHIYDKKFLDICPKCRESLNQWMSKFNLLGEVVVEGEQ